MRVLIVGGGIAGLSLALALRRHGPGHQVVVIEKSPRLRAEGYMLDFFGPGVDAAERLGIIPDLQRIHDQIDGLVFLDGSGRKRFSLRYPELRRRVFRGRHFNFMRGDLERVLHERMDGTVAIKFGVSVSSFHDDGTQVLATLTDGSVMPADLLVGADGIHSRVRLLAFGPEENFWRPLGYRAAAFVMNRVLEGAPVDTFATLTDVDTGRQVSVYPIRDGRTAALFLHRLSGHEGHHASPRHELLSAYGEMQWLVPALLNAAAEAPDVYVDDVAQVELPTWSSGRVALIGDACLAVSLLAGQGASLAMASACVLADELGRTPAVSAALARYEQRTRPAVVRKQAAGRSIARWFLPEDRLHLAIRDLAMRMSVWPITSAWVRRSIGASGIPGW